MEQPPLPELLEGLLDDEQLGQVFADLEAGAQVESILAKGSELERARRETPSLAEALRLLRSGEALGVQIRYQLGDRFWCDTLLREASGVRIVRMDVTA